jgi:tetratricopeptide (TPR) repeat protein
MEIAGKTFQALGAAHSRGIVHRDLKPENVMIDHQGSVFVMDFGVALGPGEGSQADTRFGTPSYMAPEQVQGGPIDHRTDLFALGLLLREMLSGGKAGEPESRLPHDRLPRGIRTILETLLSEDPKNRRVTPEEIDRALRDLRPASGSARSVRRIAGALGRPTGKWLLGGTGLAVILAVAFVPRILRQGASGTPSHGRLPTSEADPFYRRGLYYLRAEGETSRSLSEAIQMLNRAVEKDPSSSIAWANLAEAYWIRYERAREPSSREEALRAQERAFQQNPDLPEALNAKGRGLIATGDFTAAVAELKRAVRKKPDFDAAWANLGMAYREIKDGYRPGLQALQTAIRLSPNSFRHRVYLGLFFYRFGEYDQAEKASRKAIDLKPDSVMAWNNLGAIYLQMNRPADAVSAFQESLKLEEGAHAHSNLGTAYYFQKDFGQALEHYRRATEMEPNEPGHWGNLGDAFRMLKNGDGARRAYLEAVRRAREKLALLPQDPEAHTSLGLYCARAHEEACALEEGGKAESMQPDSLEVAFTNAVILAILGKTNDAMEHLERAVKLGLSKVRIENDPDLAPLRDLPRYRRILELAG